MIRPRPPAELLGIEGALDQSTFIPAPDLLEWARATFIEEDAPLANPEHAHLAAANIGMLWTNAPNSRNGRAIVGQCEFKPPSGTMGKWQRARAQAQFHAWFGSDPLDFLLTFYAPYADKCSDAEWCALVEHELCHAGQERDEFGAPKFAKSGMPVFGMRPHDIEQFTSVVARYGADAAGVRAMIEAAQTGPVIEGERIAACCGTCAS